MMKVATFWSVHNLFSEHRICTFWFVYMPNGPKSKRNSRKMNDFKKI